MKKLKKILMMLAICSLSIVAVSCSSEEKKNTTNETTEKKEATEKKEVKLSNEEIFKKATEATKSIKSSRQLTDYKESISSDRDMVLQSIIMQVTTSENPTVTKLLSNLKDDIKSRDFNMYFTEDASYAQDSETKKWYNVKDAGRKKTFETQKNSVNIEAIIKVLQSIEKNLKIEEKGSEYEISYSGAEVNLKDYLKQLCFVNAPLTDKLFELTDLEKCDIVYRADKSSFMPIEYTVRIKMKFKKSKKESYYVFDFKSQYYDINNVDPITLPDEVKNAQEWKGK